MRLICAAFLSTVLLGCGCSSDGASGTPSPGRAALTTAAAGQAPEVAPSASPTGDIEFKSARDLNQLSGAEPELRHGKVAISKDWPASLYATFTTSGGLLSACTAALVGPQAMLTAAHCVPPSGKVTFVYRGHPSPYISTCTKHPMYPSDASADYALCKVDNVFAAPADFFYETINTSSMDGLTGTSAILTGFGCVSDIVKDPTGKPDGKYRIGTNDIVETSNSTPPKLGSESGLYAGKQNNNLFTKDDPALANLCPGDSGGPTFRETGASAGQFTSRVIVGVNSRVFYANPEQTAYGASLISATGGPDFRTWAENWAKAIGKVHVCGIEGSIPNCRS